MGLNGIKKNLSIEVNSQGIVFQKDLGGHT